ncbi:MAG: hypothetical protein JXA89_20325 [Anaerolineae bacterium]|nr:hypothetical protein [Anaerolineae bacterium]
MSEKIRVMNPMGYPHQVTQLGMAPRPDSLQVSMLRGLHPYLPPTLILDPITARQFVDWGGFDTKEKLIR